VNAKDLADKLNGRQYTSEISRQEAAAAKSAGLVVVHGGSDDLIYFAGAISDELGAGNGAEFLVDAEGILPDWDAVESKDATVSYLRREPNAKKITAHWCDKSSGFDWSYKTDIPHHQFEILDGPDMYCRGIVFSLKDLAQ
jgi:hypothetical protein